MFENHLLSVIAYTPLVGAVLRLVVSKDNKNFIRWFANIIAASGVVVSLPLLRQLDVNADGMQCVDRHAWIPAIGVELCAKRAYDTRAACSRAVRSMPIHSTSTPWLEAQDQGRCQSQHAIGDRPWPRTQDVFLTPTAHEDQSLHLVRLPS